MAKAAAAKPMTKSQTAAELADRVEGVSKKQVTQLLAALAELAYKQAKNTFTIPGIGKLKLVDRPARKMVMRFGPNAGKEVTVPKSKKVRFAISKAAKDAILNVKK